MEVFSDFADPETFELEIQVAFEKDGFIVWHMFAHTRETGDSFYQMKKGIRLRTALIFFFRAYQRYRARTKQPQLAIIAFTVGMLISRDLSVDDVISRNSYEEIVRVSKLEAKEEKLLQKKWC